MEIYISQQSFVFLWMVLAGIEASAVYDIFRIIRKLFKMADWVVFICDAVFWIVCTLLAFTAVTYSNYGELRWFVFVGIAIGGVLYFTLLSGIVSKAVLWLLRIVVRVCLFIKKVFIFTKRRFDKPIRFVSARMRRCRKRIKHRVKKHKNELRILKSLRKTKR